MAMQNAILLNLNSVIDILQFLMFQKECHLRNYVKKIINKYIYIYLYIYIIYIYIYIYIIYIYIYIYIIYIYIYIIYIYIYIYIYIIYIYIYLYIYNLYLYIFIYIHNLFFDYNFNFLCHYLSFNKQETLIDKKNSFYSLSYRINQSQKS